MTNAIEEAPEKGRNDAPSYCLAFLSFVLPVLGMILFGVWRDSKPLKAKSCANGALIGLFANAAIGIVPRVGFYSACLVGFLGIVVAAYRLFWLPGKEPGHTFLSARITRLYPVIAGFAVIWLLCMLNVVLYYVQFFSTGKFKNNQYYAYLWRMEDADFVLFLGIGTAIVVISCILLLARRKNAVYLGLLGGIIKIAAYLICGVFLKQQGSWGNNYGPVYLNFDDFFPVMVSDIVPGLIILFFLFIGRKKAIAPKESAAEPGQDGASS